MVILKNILIVAIAIAISSVSFADEEEGQGRVGWNSLVPEKVMDIFKKKTEKNVWKIATYYNPPYADPKMEGQGIAIKRLGELLRLQGIKLQVKFYTKERAQGMATTDKYIGYYPALPADVGTSFLKSEAVILTSLGVIHHKNKKVVWAELDELFEKRTVALVKNYPYTKTVLDLAEKYPDNVIYVNGYRELIKYIDTKRAYVGIGDPNVSMFYADAMRVYTVKRHPKDIIIRGLYVAFEDEEENKKRLELLNSLVY